LLQIAGIVYLIIGFGFGLFLRTRCSILSPNAAKAGLRWFLIATTLHPIAFFLAVIASPLLALCYWGICEDEKECDEPE